MTEEQMRWLDSFFCTQVVFNEPMSKHTTFRIGGPADALVTVNTGAQLVTLTKWARGQFISIVILGGGSNLIVRDGGIRGVVVKLAGGFDSIDSPVKSDDSNHVSLSAGSGVLLRRLGQYCVDNGLKGLGFAIGIPGTVGGAIKMNAGAWGECMADVTTSVDLLNSDGEVITIDKENFGFRYRGSGLKKDEVVLKGNFLLQMAAPEILRNEATKMLQERRTTQPFLSLPSAGSIFRNPDRGLKAGALIDKAGLKGLQMGGAQVSPQHANFIVNNGGATASDVTGLISRIQESVENRFGIKLETEVMIVGQEKA